MNMDDGLEIAVVGMALRCPGAATPDEFWRNLIDGVESISHFPDDVDLPQRLRRLDDGAVHVPAAGVLADPEHFDADFFRMSPREAQLIDPQHRLLLEVAWEAFESAGIVPGAARTGVYAGAGFPTYLLTTLLDSPQVSGAGQYWLTVGNDKDHVATRLAYTLNLRGPAVNVQSACSTSLVCVHLASQSLLSGECDIAVAGASSVGFPQHRGYHYTEGGILSPDGRCRPFDVQAQGTVPGSGVGAVVLKRLADARRDGDPVRAVILATAVGNDGADRLSYAAPSAAGQAAVIRAAVRDAGVKPDEISYVEAHGTATPLGDPIEISALSRALPGGPDSAPCHLGSVKSNIGHLDVAAGLAGLVKTVLALEHEQIPPTLHYTAPNPRLELDRTRFRVADRTVAWPRGAAPRIAGVSSFGLGGTNGHLIVTEAPAVDQAGTDQTGADRAGTEDDVPVPLLLSADSPQALDAFAHRLAPALRRAPLAAAARTLALGRRARSHRRVVLARTRDEAGDLLAAERSWTEAGAGRVALVFSGAGKHAFVEAERLRTVPAFADAYDQARSAFAGLGVTLLDPETTDEHELGRPTRALPTLFAVQVALARTWLAHGVAPAAVAGHSVGEYAAAHIAGVMTLPDAAALVDHRAQLLEQVAPGQMAVVPLGPAQAGPLAERFGLSVAAVNTADSCVLSGTAADFANFREYARQCALEIQPVGVATAAHSPRLADGARQLAAFAVGIPLTAPTITYVSAVTGQVADPQELTRPEYWGEHLRRTVQFAAATTALTSVADIFVEIGPAGTVEPLIAAHPQVQRGAAVGTLPHPREQLPAVTGLRRAFGRAWAHGAPVDWQLVLGAGARSALPTAPFIGGRHVARSGTATTQPTTPTGNTNRVGEPARYEPVWQRQPYADPSATRLDGHWWILGGPAHLAEQISRHVVASGGNAHRLDQPPQPAVAAAPETAFDDTLHWLRRHLIGAPVTGLIDLTGLDRPAGAAPQGTGQPFAPFTDRLALVRLLGEQDQARLLCVSVGAVSVLGDEPADPYAALAIGPVTVADREYPGLRTTVLDVRDDTDPRTLADAVVGVLAATSPTELLALRGRHLWQRRWVATGPPQSTPPADLGTVLVTGGLGGIGRSLAVELARTGTTAIGLLGRTALPERAGWDELLRTDPGSATAGAIEAVRAIEAAGARVLTVAVDCTDATAMRSAVTEVAATLGPVRTVVHAAGVPGGGLIRLRDAADCAAVLRPKTVGTRILADVLADQPVSRVLLCSALDAVLGTVGQVDHVAGNAFLDAVSGTDWFGDAVVTSVDWGAWRDVGQAADLSQTGGLAGWRQQMLADAIRPADGARHARAALHGPGGVLAVSTVDPEELLDQARQADLVSLFQDDLPDADGQTQPRPALATPYRAPEGPIATALAEIWSAVIGVHPIGADDNYFALGGHSLAAVALVARLRRLFRFPIALTDMLTRPTVAAQAEWLTGELERYLDQLSDEEVEEQLAALAGMSSAETSE